MRNPKGVKELSSRSLTCRKCGRDVHPGRGNSHVVSILAVADPSPPVFTEDDLALDVEQEVQQLLTLLRSLDAQAAQDQLYRRIVFHLCDSCYHEWIANPTGA
jgi:hypothetical protein